MLACLVPKLVLELPVRERPRDIPAKSMTSSSPAKPQQQPGGALAEAMRRAAEKNGGPKA